MKIYVWQRNGKEWADFTIPDGVKPTRVIDVPDSQTAARLAKKETGRLAAVLERTAKDLPGFEPPKDAATGGFWRRLKWLATGK